MNDFDDLRRIREAHVNAEALARQQVLDEQQRRLQAASDLKDRKRSHGAEMNTTVMSALEALRGALYPEMKIRSQGLGKPTTTWEQGIEPYWAIVGGDNGADPSQPMAFVTVELEFDEFGEPMHFICNRLSVWIEETLPQRNSGISRFFGQRDQPEPSTRSIRVDFDPVLANMTTTDLVQALRTLHPHHTVNARPLHGSR